MARNIDDMEQTAARIVDKVWSEVGEDTIRAQKLMAIAHTSEAMSSEELAKRLAKEEINADYYRVGLAQQVEICLVAGWDEDSIKRCLINKHNQLNEELILDAMDILSEKS